MSYLYPYLALCLVSYMYLITTFALKQFTCVKEHTCNFWYYSESVKPAPARIYVMPCLCNHNRTFTNMTHDQIIEYLIQETAIQTNQTSRSLNKLRSRTDPRTSSFVMGLVGIGTIAGILGIVILWDMPTIVKHFVAALTNRHEVLYRPNRIGLAN